MQFSLELRDKRYSNAALVVSMQPVVSRKKLFQRQIPTLLGLGILVIGLVVGVLFIGDGLGVFAPRATPQTTPKNIRVSNVTDTGFTVSFLTDEATAGFVKYGTEEGDLGSQSSDDRDQLSGSVGSHTLHHITVRGLQPSTTYFYTLGTGTQSEFDNNGAPFKMSTAKRAGAPAAAKTVYGTVTSSSGAPADGSVVYITVEGVGDMSSLVKSSGSWAIPLSNARTADGSGYATIEDTTSLTINVQGPKASDKSQATVLVSEAQPVAAITLGQDGAMAAADTTAEAKDPEDDEVLVDPDTTQAVASASALPSISPTASPASGGLSELANASSASDSSTITPATGSAIVDLTQTAKPTITTTQPAITGTAVSNVVVTIKVNSTTQITQQVTADANGEFELDIATLSQQLEPGEHSVEYSYTDPTTGSIVTKTKTFTVSTNATPRSNLLAQAQPFGSGNPFPAGATPTPTPTPTPSTSTSTSSATASTSATTAKGGTATRSSQVATGSALPKAGAVSTTFALVFSGIFFLIAGGWSLWISKQLKEEF